MEPAVRASLLWGIIGALLFGAMAQAYQLFTGGGIGFLATLLVMVGVGVVTTGLSYAVDAYLP
ncbi:hypothetical protein [Halorarius litoreus]|uniref:hypothetical protein n=1 Tax=Halorarius litoreus TaxID=2962676 RepID=UPI0020CEC631|nr:hypothetical protein [Halorarius litoreus]